MDSKIIYSPGESCRAVTEVLPSSMLHAPRIGRLSFVRKEGLHFFNVFKLGRRAVGLHPVSEALIITDPPPCGLVVLESLILWMLRAISGSCLEGSNSAASTFQY